MIQASSRHPNRENLRLAFSVGGVQTVNSRYGVLLLSDHMVMGGPCVSLVSSIELLVCPCSNGGFVGLVMPK